MYYLFLSLLRPASLCFTDILKAIAAALKTKHPTKEDIKAIISKVSFDFFFLPSSDISFQHKSKHNMRAAA
jgi:hypothetical protein